MKLCPKCKQTKSLDSFRSDKRTKDGYFCYCKECESKRSQEYYWKNLDVVRERNRIRDSLNREKARDKCKTFWRTKRMTDPEYCLWAGAKARSGKLGREFTILREDIHIPEYCPVLGIQLVFDNDRGFKDNSPSIDRIDSSKGYTKENIIITSWRANRIKSDSTLDELEAVLKFYRTLP